MELHRKLAVWTVLAATLTLLGCEHYDEPRRPIPSDLRVEMLDGAVLDADALRGSPWLVAVWVPGCGSCWKELPLLESLRADYEKQGVKFLALSIEPDTRLVTKAATKLGVGLDIVGTTRREVMRPFGVDSLPSTAFIDSDGTVVMAASGVRSEKFLRQRLDALVKQHSGQRDPTPGARVSAR